MEGFNLFYVNTGILPQTPRVLNINNCNYKNVISMSLGLELLIDRYP